MMAEEDQPSEIQPNTNQVHDSPNRGPTLSTSTSSFEALDPHDPNLSRMATTMFQDIQDYLVEEVSLSQDHYRLLERLNRLAIVKYMEMHQITGNVNQNLNEEHASLLNLVDTFQKIDGIEVKVNQLEEAAFRLMSHLKTLIARFQSLENRGKKMRIDKVDH